MSDTQKATVRAKHSIVPKGVRLVSDLYPVGSDGETLCYANSAEKAALIVRAVNSHDKLLEALKANNDLLWGLLYYFEPGYELSQINAQRDKNTELLAESAIQSAEGEVSDAT